MAIKQNPRQAGYSDGVSGSVDLVATLNLTEKNRWSSDLAVISSIHQSKRVDTIIRSEVYRRNLPLHYFDDAKSDIMLMMIDNSQSPSWLDKLDKAENIYTLISGIAFRYMSEKARTTNRNAVAIGTNEIDEGGPLSLDVLQEIRGDLPVEEAQLQFDAEKKAVTKGKAEFIRKLKKNGFPLDIPSDGGAYKRIGRPKKEG